jgi:hypothetical protein
VKAAELQLALKARVDLFAQRPGGIATPSVEVHVSVPILNCWYIGRGHEITMSSETSSA